MEGHENRNSNVVDGAAANIHQVRTNELLNEMLATQRRTNILLGQLIVKVSEQPLPNANPNLNQTQTALLDENDFVLADGSNLLDVARHNTPTIYAIALAKAMFTTEELENGMVSPKAGKRKSRTALDPNQVKKIKRLIQHQYKLDEPKFKKIWPHCRRSINQAGNDAKRRKADGEADVEDEIQENN
uniref:BEN domain-containing protein n=2 Tax=Clytia hemisphaerica TaxID=252671 RepID=A0A7M5WZR4_9CNID